MTSTNSISKFFKFIPLIALLAAGLALTPVTSIAANGDRGHFKAEHSKKYSKHSNKGHSRSNKQHYSQSKHGHKNNIGHHLNRHSNKHQNNRYNSHYKRKYYSHNKHHSKHHNNHLHRGYPTTRYVVNNHDYRDHYLDFDHLRFMIGLHTNNFDLTFRD